MQKIITKFSSLNRKGAGIIAFSSLLSKISGFLLSIIIVRIVSQEVYGDISYARSLISIFTPFMGLGIMHSLLRYGSITDNKMDIYSYTIKRVLLYSCIYVSVIFFFTPLLTSKLPSSQPYFKILIFSLLTLPLFQSFQSYLRIRKENKKFAYSNILYTLFLLLFSTLTAITIGPKAYVSVSVFLPLFIWGYYYLKDKKLNYRAALPNEISTKEFHTYGLWIGIGSMAYMLLTTMDTLMVGAITGDSNLVAIYRIGVMIPLQFNFIPASFMTADFVYLAERSNDKVFLIQKFRRYSSMFLMIGLVLVTIIWLSGDFLVTTIYSSKYHESSSVMKILSISMLISFTVKIPVGNIFNAIGKAKINVINVWISLVINLVLNFYLIKSMGIKGAAIATLITNFFSSVAGLICFIWLTSNRAK